MTAAGRLDARRGRICGYALSPRGPATVELRLGGALVQRLVAGGPVAALLPLPALAAAAPAEPCSFAASLPRRALRDLAPGEPVELSLRVAGQADPFFTHRFAGPAEAECYTEGARMAARYSVGIDGLAAGVLTGRITPAVPDAPAPVLAAQVEGRRVAELDLAEDGRGGWTFRAALPADLLSDGVRHVEIASAGGEVLARHPLAAGAVVAVELAAEVALLRAEMDELRRAAFAAFSEPALAAADRPLIVAELVGHVEALLGVQDARVEAELDRLRALLEGSAEEPEA